MKKLPAQKQLSAIQHLNHELDELRAQLLQEKNKNRLLDNLDEFLWSVDAVTLKPIEMSAACESIFGFSREQMMENIDLWKEYVHPADHKIIERNNEPLLTGDIVKKQYRVIHKNGATKWVETKLIPVMSGNKLVRIDGITRDITREKRSHKALLESEFLFRQFFDLANEAIIVLDLNTGFISDYNRNSLDLLGYSGSEILQMGPVDFSPEFQPNGILSAIAIAELINRTLAGEKLTFEWFICHARGRLIPVEVRLSHIKAGDRAFIRASILDISARKKNEEEIRAGEERYRLVSEAPTLGIGWASVNGQVLKANQGLCNMLQYTEEDLKKLKFTEFTYAEDLEKEMVLFAKMLKGEITNYRIEKRYITSKGQLIWVDANISAFVNEKGDLKYFIGVIQDINARKIAEHEVLALNEMLERKIVERTEALTFANQELDAFNHTVSHDLQAPLRIMQGCIDILIDQNGDQLDNEGKEMLNIIRNNSARMSRLIKELLEFAKLGKAEPQKVQVDMGAIVKVVMAEILYNNPNAALQVNSGHIYESVCDPILIRQVWANLISNAVKYSSKKQNPVIQIGSDKINGEIIYYVKDNGAGFDMKYAPKLFGVFKRLHNYSEFEGTGVGLATVHRIVTRLGGRVWAEGKENEGATFYFTIAG